MSRVFTTVVELRGLTALDEVLHCCGDRVDVVVCMYACKIVVYSLSSIAGSRPEEILRRRTSSKRVRGMLKLTTTIANGINHL